MKKICIVSGSRAEWGLLSRFAGFIKSDPELQLQIIVTNMHLIERYGYTYKEIEQDGFEISFKVPMDIDRDNANAIVKSMGKGIEGFADAYEKLQPDMLVVLGDRYEILAAVTAALIYKIPVAHLHGGEITEGAYDDAIRHAITKMSRLHFTSTEEYRHRVIQMGEQPDTVFNVGAIGVDNIKHLTLWNRTETEKSLGGFSVNKQTILVTYHPVTLEDNTAEKQIDELLSALDAVKELRIIFTMPNSDTDNRIIAEKIQNWCNKNSDRAIWFTSLGQKRYFSVLQYIGGVVGNSSSGIIEVPSFGIPTINIGDRQKGRVAAKSVINCLPRKNELIEKLLLLLHYRQVKGNENPYYQSDTARKVYLIVKNHTISLQKQFYNL